MSLNIVFKIPISVGKETTVNTYILAIDAAVRGIPSPPQPWACAQVEIQADGSYRVIEVFTFHATVNGAKAACRHRKLKMTAVQ
jgi:hypothetical protein